MSGIAGILSLTGRRDNAALAASMIAAIAHRGPDGSGTWNDDKVALGHQMMWTTPESLRETLPLYSRNFVITADARIDNRKELHGQLDFNGRKLEQIADSELILAAYEKWGRDCPNHLLGDYAFAIWDIQQQSLFCARDCMGVRPLYYCHFPGQFFAFASEIKALLALPEVPCELNETRIADYIEVNFEDRVSTFYRHVFRLAAAQWLEVNPDRLALEKYWSLDSERELRLSSDDEYAEAFLEQFTRSVRARLRSAYRVGASLSGGLDSSSIVCLARKLLKEEGQEQLHTFSLVFPSLPEGVRALSDERPYIEKVLDGGGLQAHFVHGDQHTPLGNTSDLLQVLDEPCIGPNLFINWGICQAAQEAGVRALLDGFGGDSVISHGMAYLTELAHRGEWKVFSDEVSALSRLYQVAPRFYLQTYGVPFLSALVQSGRWIPFLRNTMSLARYSPVPRSDLVRFYGVKPLRSRVRRRWAQPATIAKPELSSGLLDPNFAKRVGYSQQSRPAEKPSNTLRADQYSALSYAFLSVGLEEANKLMASFSVDIAFPYFDRPLMEYCLSLPGDQKLKNGWGRMYMRRALKGILPEEIRWRSTKGDFGPNFTRGFSQFDRPIIDQIIRDTSGVLDGYIRFDTVNRLYNRYLATRNRIDELNLWRIMNLSVWLGRFSRHGIQHVSV